MADLGEGQDAARLGHESVGGRADELVVQCPQEAFVVHGAGGEGHRLLACLLRDYHYRRQARPQRLDSLPMGRPTLPPTVAYWRSLLETIFVTVAVTFRRRWCCKVLVVAEGTSERDRGGARANTRASALIAWSTLAACLTLAMFVATIPLWFLARSADLPSSWRADGGVGGLVGGAFFLAFPLVGALLASRRPQNAVGWLCLAVGLLWTLLGMFDYYGYYGAATPGSVPFPVDDGRDEPLDVGAHRRAAREPTSCCCSRTGGSLLGGGAPWRGSPGR